MLQPEKRFDPRYQSVQKTGSTIAISSARKCHGISNSFQLQIKKHQRKKKDKSRSHPTTIIRRHTPWQTTGWTGKTAEPKQSYRKQENWPVKSPEDFCTQQDLQRWQEEQQTSRINHTQQDWQPHKHNRNIRKTNEHILLRRGWGILLAYNPGRSTRQTTEPCKLHVYQNYIT